MNITESTAITLPSRSLAAPTPLDLLSLAIDRGADIDQLERFQIMVERAQASQAERSYNSAFAAFKAEEVRIKRDVHVKAGPMTGKKYADLSSFVNGATAALSKHGLSASWKITKDEPNWIEVTCILRHIDGHSDSAAVGGPPDTGPGRNAMQARCSTISYCERYSFKAVTGLSEAGQDDDGNGGQAKPLARSKEAQKLFNDWSDYLSAAINTEDAAVRWAECSEAVKANKTDWNDLRTVTVAVSDSFKITSKGK